MSKRMHIIALAMTLVSLCYSQGMATRKDVAYATTGAKTIIRSSNDSVGVIVERSGIFSIGTAGGRSLLYGYPHAAQTSHVHFFVDGTVQGNYSTSISGHPEPARIVELPHRVGDTVACAWNVNGVTFRQKLVPVYLGTDPQIRIAYDITNDDVVSHNVGLLVFLDTKIASNDCAPIATPLGYFESEREFFGALPTFWQAFEQSPLQPPDKLVCLGVLSGFDATVPDVLLYGDFWNYNTAAWDYTFAGGLYSDSAVLLRWNTLILDAGENRSIITYCGIGISERSIGELAVGATVPEAIVPVGCNSFSPDSFVITAFVSSETPLDDGRVTITLPPFLSSTEDLTKYVSPAHVEAGMIASAMWNVAVVSGSSSGHGTVTLAASSPVHREVVVERHVNISAPDGAPPMLAFLLPLPDVLATDTLTVRFQFSDATEGIDFSRARVELDGSLLLGVHFADTTGFRLVSLSEGEHVLNISGVSDIFGCEAPAFTHRFTVDFPETPHCFFLDPGESEILSCASARVAISISCPAGFDAAHSSLTVDGTPQAFSYLSDSVVATISLTEGEHLLYFDCRDLRGESSTCERHFIVDQTAPIAELVPSTFALRTPSELINISIRDAVAGVDRASVGMNIRLGDSEYTFSATTPGVMFRDSSLTFALSTLPLILRGCTHLTVEIFACDRATVCGGNCDTVTLVSAPIPCSPPEITILSPGGVVSCDTILIKLLLTDEEGIIADSLWIDFAGTRYDMSSPHVHIIADTVFFSAILPAGTSTGTINVRIGGITDVWGTELSAETMLSVLFDNTAPIVSNVLPVGNLRGSEQINIMCADIPSGISPLSYVICDGETITQREGLVFSSDGISVPSHLWLSALEGEDLTLCWRIFDVIAECEPNIAESCKAYHIEQSGPSITQIMPPIGIFIGCHDFSARFIVFDPDGVDHARSSIEFFGHNYAADDARFSWSADTITIPFTSLSGSSASLIFRCVDALGFSTTQSFVINTDFSPPQILYLQPAQDATIDTAITKMIVVLVDSISGIDYSTLVFSVAGRTFSLVDSVLQRNGDTLIFDFAKLNFDLPPTFSVDISVGDRAYDCANVLLRSVTYRLFEQSFWWELLEPHGIASCDTVDVKLLLHKNFPVSLDSAKCVLGSAHSCTAQMNGDTLFMRVAGNLLSSGVNTLRFWGLRNATNGRLLPDTISVAISYDALPPSITPISPLPLANLTGNVSLKIVLSDDESGIFHDGILIELNSAPVLPADAIWRGDTIFATLENVFIGENNICISASDLPDICEPHTARVCWKFNLAGEIGVLRTVEPQNGAITHNTFQPVRLKIEANVAPIDYTSFVLTVNGMVFDSHSPNISLIDNEITFTPSLAWTNNDTIVFSGRISDVNGAQILAQPQSFVCDFAPPQISNPQPFGYVDPPAEHISVSIADDIAGVDANTIVFYIGNLVLPFDNYSVTYLQGRAHLDLGIAGVSLSALDTIDVCVSCFDNATGYGLPLASQNFCFWFAERKDGCIIESKTISPNGDGVYDEAVFSAAVPEAIILKILSRDGNLVREISGSGELTWNATDNAGRKVPSGAYFYMLESDGKPLCKGSIIVVR